MKVIVTGPGGHGKGTFCSYLGLDSASSSLFANGQFVYHTLKHVLGYESMLQCYNDRTNHRALWYELIKAYNSENPARLAVEIFQKVAIYDGMRCDRELEVVNKYCKQKYEPLLVIWLEDERKHGESAESMTITRRDCDITINNDGSLAELQAKAVVLRQLLGRQLTVGFKSTKPTKDEENTDEQ